ncbi:MAG: hypothetical protein AAF333_00650 [Planctomycetota bacterium]
MTTTLTQFVPRSGVVTMTDSSLVNDRQGRVERSEKLAAIVLLVGGPGASELASTGCSTLDLPLRTGWTVCDQWLGFVESIREIIGQPRVPVLFQIGCNQNLSSRTREKIRRVSNTELCSDESTYRGLGGVLRDLSRRFTPEDDLLVFGTSQLITSSTETVAQELVKSAGDGVVWTHEGGRLAGGYRLSCQLLAELSSRGYIDFKEQALPRLRAIGYLRTSGGQATVTRPIRTRAQYLAAVAAQLRDTSENYTSYTNSGWDNTASLVGAGAAVSRKATVVGSVILEGARINRHALVARSVIGRDAIVPAYSRVVDQVWPARAKYPMRSRR